VLAHVAHELAVVLTQGGEGREGKALLGALRQFVLDLAPVLTGVAPDALGDIDKQCFFLGHGFLQSKTGDPALILRQSACVKTGTVHMPG
jgi:hypothetical protein